MSPGRYAFAGVLALMVTAAAASPSSAAVTEDDARQFIQTLTDRADEMFASNLPKAARDERFAQIMSDGFDIRAIGVFCMGGYWNKASEQERQEYLKLFKDLVVLTYSGRLSSFYHGEKLELGSIRPDGKDGEWVSSKIVSPNPSVEPVRVDWRVRQPNNGAAYKIVDVVVMSVSMVVTQRDEFVSVLQRNGGNIQSFLDTLRDKVTKLQSN